MVLWLFLSYVCSMPLSWRWSGSHVLKMKRLTLSVESLTMMIGASTPVCFKLLMQDCYALQHNTLLPRFHSRFWVPGCEAVDTFTTNWGSELNWWLPPLYLVCRTISHALSCQAKGTLIVPAWKSAPYWPIICPDGRHLAGFVHLWWPIKFY